MLDVRNCYWANGSTKSSCTCNSECSFGMKKKTSPYICDEKWTIHLFVICFTEEDEIQTCYLFGQTF
jgi:hypothetical protein